MSSVKFKIVIPSRNCLEWLPRCLESIASQTYRNFDLVIVDDASTDCGQWEWMEYYCKRQGWLALRGEKSVGSLGAIVRATRAAEPRESDVIVHVDGDDWLAHDGVLSYLASIYRRGEVDLTYGGQLDYPKGCPGYTRPYPKRVVQERSYRLHDCILWGHLRSFRHFLWEAIRDEDLRAPCGEYFRFANDHAYMFPLIEMAGDRFAALSEALYIYNRINPRSEMAFQRVHHLSAQGFIRIKPKYPVHERCKS